jgi:hypothetical protein
MRIAVILAGAVGLAGCATTEVGLPRGYSGPTSFVDDSARMENQGKGAFFVLAAIDGREIQNSLQASRAASHGRGFSLSPTVVGRDVPAVKFKAKLIGTHQTAAPIHEMAARMAGSFFAVEGLVDFAPVPDVIYTVNGELNAERSCVWIEEYKTKLVVTEKVCGK